ncbi:MAG TPA: D-alanyl-D-alanine carboxypeptidase family protein [Alphaproteobacteria bacterium]|nr:D-alanyl-D-alanine carboxypeptidase family protein [Alphaproteobacteria bacterium]
MMKLFLSFAVFGLFVSASAMAQEVVPPTTEAKQAYIVDADTGTVLFEKSGNERMPTSSMSKVLTTIVADDAIRSGQISKDQLVTVSEKAWKMEGSRMFLDVNTTVSIGDLLKGIIIQSGNDACVALAEGIAGSEANYVAMMNLKAEEIGMKDSHFMNSNGLPDPNHYSTAHDLALMGMYLIRNYPEEYKTYAEKEFTYNNIKQGNRNPLLYKNIGADGIKTGHTEEGGYGMIGSAVAGGRRVIVVINGTSSMQARADESSKLMEWALTSFKNVDLITQGNVLAKAPVVLGEAREIEMAAGEGYRATIPSFAKNPAKISVTYKSPVVAPVKKGDVLGAVNIALAGGATKEIPLVANADIVKSSFFKQMAEKFMILLVGVPE